MLITLTYMFKFQVHVDMHSPVCGNTSNNSQYELSLMIITMQYGVVKSFMQAPRGMGSEAQLLPDLFAHVEPNG